MARVVKYNDYHIGESSKCTTGYAVEVLINEASEWELMAFVEIKDEVFIHESLLAMWSRLSKIGYQILWDT